MLLGWIPILGPIIDGIVSVVKGFQNVEMVKYKTDAQVDIEATKASANIIAATKDDIGIRLARDIVIFPWAIWGGLMGWDTVIAKHWPDLMWHVPEPPVTVAYLPGMVLVFLLGNIGFNIWRHK